METHEEIRQRIRALVSGRGASSRWITQHLEYAIEDWCLIYPFAWEEDHYPKYKNTIGGHHYPVHRLMCEYRHGAPPTPSHQSAHSCDRGTKGCVNPMHVSWKTASENQFDRFKGEAKRPRCKISPEDADEIRRLAQIELPKDIAKKFGITVRNVRFVLSGKAWEKTQRALTRDEVLDIRNRARAVGIGKMAQEYGVHRETIYRVLDGRSYGSVI